MSIDPSKEVLQLAEKLKSRFTIFLRQTEIGDRRRHDRLPCDLRIALRNGRGEMHGQTADLSEGGILMRPQAGRRVCRRRRTRQRTSRPSADAKLRLVGRSQLGLHLNFVGLAGDAEIALDRQTADHPPCQPRIHRARDRDRGAHLRLVRGWDRRGQISQSDLFDIDYVPIEGTNPQQFRTRYLDWLDRVLPPIQEAVERRRRTHDFLRGDRPQRAIFPSTT